MNPESSFYVRRIQCGLVVCLSAWIGLAFTSSLVAQSEEMTKPEQETTSADELGAAIQRSREIYETEFKPLQDRMNAGSQRIYAEYSSQQSFVRGLETAKDDTLERTRREIDSLSMRLETLMKLEEVLSDMDPDAKEKAIEKGKEKLAELDKERKEARVPLQLEMNDLQRAYADENRAFGKKFETLFREAGTGDFEGFERKYVGGSLTSAQANARFDHENKQRVTISLMFASQNRYSNMLKGKEKYKDKYPIINETPNNLLMLVGDVQLSIYVSKKNNPVKLSEFANNLIDLEQLEKLGARKKKK